MTLRGRRRRISPGSASTPQPPTRPHPDLITLSPRLFWPRFPPRTAEGEAALRVPAWPHIQLRMEGPGRASISIAKRLHPALLLTLMLSDVSAFEGIKVRLPREQIKGCRVSGRLAPRGAAQSLMPPDRPRTFHNFHVRNAGAE